MISIDWLTKVITIPQSDLTPVAGSLYELDVDWFRLALKNFEDSEEGMSFPDTHRHNTEVTLGGVTYARTFEIINGYTVTFEEVGPPYRVKCVGANHNISDVQNLNNVSLIVGNAAGLIVKSIGSGLSQEEHDALMEVPTLKSYVRNKKALVKVGSVWHFRIYALDGSTPIIDKELKDKDGLDITDLLTGIQAQEAASSV
jgi:hypothetical protein